MSKRASNKQKSITPNRLTVNSKQILTSLINDKYRWFFEKKEKPPILLLGNFRSKDMGISKKSVIFAANLVY